MNSDKAIGSIVPLVVGVGVAVLVLIFVGTLGGQTYQLVEHDIETIGNYSARTVFLANNVTAEDLGYDELHPGTLIVTWSGKTIGLGNFTVDYTKGTIKLVAKKGAIYNDTDMNATFWYGNTTIKESVRGGMVSSFEALEQSGNYLPMIVLVVVIALVLMMILPFTGGKGGSGNSL